MPDLRAILTHRLMTLAPLLFMACGHKRTLGKLSVDSGADRANNDASDGPPDGVADVLRDAGPDAFWDALPDADAASPIDVADLAGDVIVNWIGSAPTTAVAGQPVFIDVLITSAVTLDGVTFALNGHLVGQTWPVSLVDITHTHVLNPPQVVLNRGQSMSFAVRVDPPAGTNAQSVYVSAQAIASPSVSDSSELLSFVVGGATPEPDPTYAINTTGTPILLNGATLESGDTLVMPQASSRAIIHLQVDVPAGASLNLTVTPTFFGGATAAGWTASAIPPSFAIAPPNRSQTIDLDIRATASSTPGFVSLVLTNNSVSGAVQTRTFALHTN
jgi:hypothetical protein